MNQPTNQNELIICDHRMFILSPHAKERLAERFPDLDILTLIKDAVPFGAQKGPGGMLFLSPTYKAVLACEKDNKVNIIKTVLTVHQAISNMEQFYLIDDVAIQALQEYTRTKEIEHPPIADQENSVLKKLAEEHVAKNYDKKERNKILRNLGYDTSGESGEIYRRYLKEALAKAYRRVYEINKSLRSNE